MDAQVYLERIRAINIEEIAKEVLTEKMGVIPDYNAEQLAQGLRTDSSRILPPYRPLTIELKRGKPGLSGVTDRVTLYNTGNHYRQLFARLLGNFLEFGSFSPLSEKLANKYETANGKLYGLTDENKEEFIDTILLPEFYSRLEKALNY